MSSRALRRLRGKQRGQEALDLQDTGDGYEEQAVEGEEEELDEAVLQPNKTSCNVSRKAKKNKVQKNLANIYELVSQT